MEQYVMGSGNQVDSVTVVQGKYYEKIHEKHVSSYGEFGAANIRDNITSTFRETLIQLNTPSKSNNMLLVGKVQSGKTSNLELFTALAFDNGFNLVIIYGGYDSTLLSQTTNRFKKTFDIPNDTDYSDDTPVVFSSDDSAQLLTVDDEIIEDLLDADKPIFLISMKRPAAMNKVNDLLARIDKSNLKAFIIDDEGDQASLNTKKNKAIDASATYASIVSMKDHLSDPLYLSVTATPQALIFLDEYSRLRPDSIRLIEPGKGYYDLLSNVTLQNTSAGRVDGGTTAQYSIISRDALSALIDHMQAIFDLEPFERRPLIDLIESSGDIPVILMNDVDGSGRKRSFYPNNKIYALQQGADNKDKDKAVFLGDSHVVVDANQINIQIHKIIPKKKDSSGNVTILTDYTQYMFAIYVPKEKKYYVKG